MSKNKKRAQKQVKNLGDVTINDYANSTVITNREKKSNANVNTVVKQLEVDKSWEDKDFDDIDFVQKENDDGTISYELAKNIPTKGATENQINSPKDYHLDVWFLISEYLRPEDVGRFAAICKTSYAVVNSAKFWFNLYKRYYNPLAGLPERFQPKCMLRIYGVRTNVIRSLFYLYPTFVDRLKRLKCKEHPEVLKNRQCVLMHIQRNKREYVIFFKLKNVPVGKPVVRKQDLMEVLDDVTANSEEDCRMLYITTPDYVHIPPVQGLYLTSVSVSLSKGLRHNKIVLGFNSVRGFKASGDSYVCVVIDQVVNLKILDWWHPSYPFNNALNYKPQDED